MKPVLTLKRGDTRDIRVKILDVDSEPFNLGQADTMVFTVKERKTDPDESALIVKALDSGITITNSLGGLATIRIDPADTSVFTELKRGLHWDIQITTLDDEVYTLIEGLMRIEPDVTQG